jgi:TM2 domain-containing membrane protein YozV
MNNLSMKPNDKECTMSDASNATPANPTPTNVTVNVTAPQAVLPTRRVNKVVYILLTFFFSYIGVHRFIRGQVGLGILYILTGGIFGVGALIDFIISLVKLGSYPGDDYEFSYVPNGHWASPTQS